MPEGPIVFVGKRRPALAAARRLGLATLLVAELPPGRRDAPLVDRHLPHDPRAAGAEPGLVAELAPVSPRAVLAATEGSVRLAAALRGALGLAGLAPAAAERAADKLAMKRAVAAAGLPVARFCTAEEGLDRRELVDRLGLPLVIKPRIGWGSRHSTVARTAAELPRRLPPGHLAEAFVAGEEMSLEAFVHDGRIVFTNATEYVEPGWENLVPRTLTPIESSASRRLLERALPALRIDRGVVHLEIFLTDAGPVFGEIAARPPGGHIFHLIELAYGFDPWRAWIVAELGEAPAVATRPRRCAGVRLLYPGPGTVTAIHGLEAAGAVPGIVEASVRVRPGTALGPRRGVGQEAGRLVATGRDRAAVLGAIARAREVLAIEVEAPSGSGIR